MAASMIFLRILIVRTIYNKENVNDIPYFGYCAASVNCSFNAAAQIETFSCLCVILRCGTLTCILKLFHCLLQLLFLTK